MKPRTITNIPKTHLANARRIIAVSSGGGMGQGFDTRQPALDYLQLPGSKFYQRQLYARFADKVVTFQTAI
jgi:hypothetical protein